MLLKLFFQNLLTEKNSSFQLYLFRYIFGSLSITFSLNCFDQLTFIVNEDNTHIFYIKISLILWLIVSLFFTIGFSNVFVRILLFTSSTYCLFNFDACWNIEPKFYVTTSFFLIFMQIDKICFWNYHKIKIETWPLNLLFLSQLLNFFTGGGFTKLFDTVWFNGYGAYYCLMVPWVKTDSISEILNYETFLIVLNYIILITELFAFVLFFFRKTRFFAFIIYFSFGLFTTFIFRIDLIGPLALALSLLFSSLFNFRLSDKYKIIFDKNYGFFYNISCFFLKINEWFSLSFKLSKPLSFTILNIFIYYSFSTSLIYNLYYQVELFKRLPRFDQVLIKFENFSKFYYFRELTCIRPDSLFTRQHFENLTAFKIEVIAKNGTIENPIIVFNDDLSGGQDTTGFLKSRYYSAFMYDCHYFRNILWGLHEKSDIDIPRQVFSMINHIREKSTIPSDQIASIKLFIKHITQPNHFQGNVKLWLNDPWFNVMEFKNSKHSNVLINETMKENYPEPQILLKDSLGINDIIAKLRLHIRAIF